MTWQLAKKWFLLYAGPADNSSFDDASKVSEVKTQKIKYTAKEQELYASAMHEFEK